VSWGSGLLPNDYKHKADITRLWSRGKLHREKRAFGVAEVRILDRYRSRFNLGHAIQCETFPTLG
jgi:hypothetical protein